MRLSSHPQLLRMGAGERGWTEGAAFETAMHLESEVPQKLPGRTSPAGGRQQTDAAHARHEWQERAWAPQALLTSVSVPAGCPQGIWRVPKAQTPKD